MVRIIAFLVGLFFAGMALLAFVVNGAAAIKSPAEPTASEEFHLASKPLHLASDGPFGKFDNRQLQRGFQIYKEVCSNCHNLHQVAFRDLKEIGYSDAEVKAIAKQWANKQPTKDEKTGDAGTRDNLPSDRFPTVYYPGQGNPPDLSLITKAREGGAAYVHSLLTGYTDEATFKNPKGELLLKKFPDAKTPDGLYFNPYFANLNLAMPQPLTQDGQVTYAPGNPKPTVDQMARDVSAFLVWTAEPKLEERHRYGLVALAILVIGSLLGFFAYKETWRSVKYAPVAPIGPLDPETKEKTTRARKKAGVAS
ncbi:cytochrome c1 [Sphingomonas sp. ASV193]|uniref:cytochrome c1 n=1 Tax=Sphingomonas sp. ASV193 TaxID=3144405 RepID=UPI0032E92AA0